MAIDEAAIEALKERMPEYLAAVHGVDDIRRKFRVPWREDRNPSAKYIPTSFTVIDNARNVAKDVFQLAGHDFGIDYFPDQVAKVAEITHFGEIPKASASAPSCKKKMKAAPRFDAPKRAGFSRTPIGVFECMRVKLFENETALSYLLSRGFDRPKIWRNHLGWCPTRSTFKNDDGSLLFTKPEPHCQNGFIIIPYMDPFATSADYAMLRTVPADKPPENKELRPAGVKSPLYREWLLCTPSPVVYVVEGLLDCLAMEMLTGRPCVALGGIGMQKRLGQVLNMVPKNKRPKKIVIAMDNDPAGFDTAKKIAHDLDFLGIPNSSLSWPSDVKDACDVLERRMKNGR